MLVCGLFWKRANATALCSRSPAAHWPYCAAMAAGFKVADLQPDRHRRDGGRRPHGGGNARWQAERSRPYGRLLPDGLVPQSVNAAHRILFRDPGTFFMNGILALRASLYGRGPHYGLQNSEADWARWRRRPGSDHLASSLVRTSPAANTPGIVVLPMASATI